MRTSFAQDEFLDDNLLELDEGTKARNREFQRRLDEIWQSASQYEARLRVEAREAVESILHLKDEYDVHIQEFSSNMQREIKSIFDKFDDVVLPAESSRVDVIEERLDIFIKQTVPATIEAQSGEVSRQLKRAYETFDIEKKKEEKRESKLVTRASKHIQKTGQRFEDESAFISSSFFSVEDDVAECERRAVRNHHHQLDQVSKSIVQINSVSTKESKERMAEDCIVLDTLIDTQKLLQQTVRFKLFSNICYVLFSNLVRFPL